MSKPCTTLLSGSVCKPNMGYKADRKHGLHVIIPVRPERSEAENSVHPERSVAKSKDALFVLASLLMVAALAGCGGGGGKTAALPAPVPVEELPQGSMLREPRTLRPGESLTLQNPDGTRTVVTCPPEGDACVVSRGPDGTAQYTGGKPTVVTVSYTTIQLPDDHELMAGTIPAGEFRTVHRTFDTRTVVTCPADGEDCEVTTVTDNGAESTGGAPTVTTYTTLYLPSDLLLSDHTLTGGTTVPAGEVRSIGYSRGRSHSLVCPFDGEDCVVTLGEDGEFESTGGAPYVVSTITNQMVWIANNGADGTSDGAHARGFEGRLLSSGALNNLFTADPVRNGANVQSTLASEWIVEPTASWASSDRAPTLGLTVAGSATFPVDDDSEAPSLGEGWNGVALRETGFGGAVIYSNIAKQPAGGSADAYYLTFGAWLTVPSDPTSFYRMGAFADGPSASRISRSLFNLQINRHTFEGPATGLYTRATYSGSGGERALRSAEVGSFTALARLSVDFGQTTTAIAGFSGSVTDFRENGESLGDWEVSLAETSANPTGNDQLFMGNTSGSAQGRSLTGRWGVEFYRNTTGASADYAAGTFSASTAAANNDALRIVGAFGTEIQR